MTSMLLTLVLVFLFQILFYSWWWAMLIPLVLGFLEKDSAAKASLGSGSGVFVLWFGMALFQWFSQGEFIVPRISAVIGVGSGFILVLITAILGLLVASVSGYAGFAIRKAVIKEYQVS